MAETGNIDEREISYYLKEAGNGNNDALNKLVSIAYAELRENAHNLRVRFFDIDTLNTTAIVHETYLKLLRTGSGSFKNRSHFFFASAKAMRQILINASLKKRTLKRGGGTKQVALGTGSEASLQLSDQTSEQLLMINDALEKLEACNDRQARIVECRFFGGMSVEETAEVLQISPATVKRSWSMARSWLYTQYIEG
ncbi:MAG: sigma-70 family RNA polymerase sigma factor [Marinilabiliales bacterium]|nr:MAG: sigma-70 family RNA polymerase sigma factor [Marinilabiliales bacterium]